MLPKVYEGLYNPLSRFAERELNRALDYYGMCFYAYNPLAGGMLTNKYSGKEQDIEDSRKDLRIVLIISRDIGKTLILKLLTVLKKPVKNMNINIVEAAYRWLANHSMLNGDKEGMPLL